MTDEVLLWKIIGLPRRSRSLEMLPDSYTTKIVFIFTILKKENFWELKIYPDVERFDGFISV